MSSAFPSRTRNGGRQLESGALTALLPLIALVPVSLVALSVYWLIARWVVDIALWTFALGYLAAGIVLFFRPMQRLLLTRLLGARSPSRQELAVLEPVWREVTQSVHVPSQRFVLAVLDAEELNAFASGGHLVVVTSFAVEVLPDDELAGVLAHELSHHLGLHTVALTVGLWLSLPVLVLARIGFFLQSVAYAATDSFASGSPGLWTVGRIVSGVLKLVAWGFLSGVLISNAVGNVVGQGAEFQADRRAVEMGFGHQLAAALRRFVASGLPERQASWRERLAISHPAPRTRVARIEAQLRRRR
jgi:Zn-dependent protease with chaperone function